MTLLDDVQLHITRAIRVPSTGYRRQRALLLAPVIALIVAISAIQFLATLGWRTPMQRTFPYLRYTEGWYAVNPYGLFAIMTTTRPEIIVEGSNDGQTWKEYVFKYKPGPLNRRPPWFCSAYAAIGLADVVRGAGGH